MLQLKSKCSAFFSSLFYLKLKPPNYMFYQVEKSFHNRVSNNQPLHFLWGISPLSFGSLESSGTNLIRCCTKYNYIVYVNYCEPHYNGQASIQLMVTKLAVQGGQWCDYTTTPSHAHLLWFCKSERRYFRMQVQNLKVVPCHPFCIHSCMKLVARGYHSHHTGVHMLWRGGEPCYGWHTRPSSR